jgi:hypothetical protein
MKLEAVLGTCLLFAAMLMTPSASAAQFAVKDVSNTIITCDSPLLQHLRAGTCIGYGPKTLLLTITAAPNEFKLRCSGQFCSPGYDTYIVALYQGRPYLYTYGWPRWQLLPADVSNARPTIPWRLPFSSLTFSGKIEYSDTFQLNLDDTYDDHLPAGLPFAGLEIYAGVSPVGQKVFTPDTFRRIWPQP